MLVVQHTSATGNMSWKVKGSRGRVCEWITITANQDIHRKDSPGSRAWLEMLRKFKNRTSCDGLEETFWSRVIESPDRIWIWTFWTKAKFYDRHRGESTYQELIQTLTEFSTTEPIIWVIEMEGNAFYSMRCLLTGGWPSITLAYFGKPLQDNQEILIRRARSIEPRWFQMRDPPKHGCSRGFLRSNWDHTIPSTGKPAIIYVMIDWWEDPRREEEVREEEVRNPEVTAEYPGEHLSLQERLNRELKEAGCIEKAVYHTQFNWVIDLDDTEEKIAGASLVFSPRKVYYSRTLTAEEEDRLYDEMEEILDAAHGGVNTTQASRGNPEPALANSSDA
ncbi:hypothetical protein BCR34DRAFT_666084 [Clohesyomyces aquaticus]|uniref:Uncharacterized protein n=1 Tax=Clohesyomyces aquaticus TaxID=1231657 RepID=A0A1Y1ZE39_9PLEO|nr:hypothetical protein BCR34DRAFT_666084 [Clohesyomyces aquaticus]